MQPDAEAVSAADFSKTETLLDASVPADPPKEKNAEKPVRIKIKEAIGEHCDCPQIAVRQRHSSPINPAQSVSEKQIHLRMNLPTVKTRERLKKDVFIHGDTHLSNIEIPVPDMRTSDSKIQKVRQIFRRRTFHVSGQRGEAFNLQPITLSSQGKTDKEPIIRQQALVVKTKGAYHRQQTVNPSELPAPIRTQGKQEFIREQGRKEVVCQTELRQFKAKDIPAVHTGSEKAVFQSRHPEEFLRPSSTDILSTSIPLQDHEGSAFTSVKADKPARKAVKKTAVKKEKVVKTASVKIKNSYPMVKAADRSAKASQKTVQAAVKPPQRALKAVRTTAKTGIVVTREAVKTSTAAIKTAITAAQDLTAAITAGGWAVIVVVLVICMAGLLIASPYGIFFSNSDSTDTITPTTLIAQINRELNEKLSELQESETYDRVEIQGQPPDWRDVLAVFAVINADNPGKEQAELLREVFWNMTKITTESKTIEHPASENNAAWTETVLTITIKARTTDDMRVFYQLSDQQNGFLDNLLAEENSSLWDDLLTGSSEEIVSIALSQVGNIGGQPYWSWYGFDSHVNWCACFVSWCANECGYIQAGIIPRFASCTAGSNWFKARDLWKPRGATPDVGDLVFFDWDTDGLPDHVGIVECVKDEKVYTVEGNSSDRCRQRSYSISYSGIFGYGTPDY